MAQGFRILGFRALWFRVLWFKLLMTFSGWSWATALQGFDLQLYQEDPKDC